MNNVKHIYIPAGRRSCSLAGTCAPSRKPLLSYNLQFFGDGPGGEKTEAPTEKRISDTRKKGQVAKSQELANSFELIGIFLMLRLFGTMVGGRFEGLFNWAFGNEITEVVASDRSGLTTGTVARVLGASTLQYILAALPFLLGGFLIAFFSNGLQFKFQISTEPLKPSFDKFNPIQGFKRMFNTQALFRLLLSIAKIALIGAIAYSYLSGRLKDIFLLYEMPLNQGISLVLDMVVDLGLRISLVYLVIGFADFFFQRWKFNQNLKMTKQEVKDEYKDQEGDPEIKSRQKQKMREASQRRMMKYDTDVAPAPILVAKGEEYLAQRIREAAKEAGVPIVENKPLARAIYTTVDLDQEIPAELYQAVAEILAMVYSQQGRTARRPGSGSTGGRK